MHKTQKFITKITGPYSEPDESSSYPHTLFLYDASKYVSMYT